MEEESVCSSPAADITDSVLQQPQQESWTSIDHQYVNGEQQAIVWGETEVQLDRAHGAEDEAEQWEQIIWPVRPVTCAGAPLSFATVQWDMPDPMTDSSLANELNSRDVTATSPSLHPSEDERAELFAQEDTEEGDGFESQLLNSDREWTGDGLEPCDAVDVQEPTTQEKEDLAHKLLDSSNEILLRTDSEEEEEEEEGHSATSYPVEAVDLIDILEETEGSEDEVDGFVDLKLEEEQEEPSVLLTGRGDSEEEQTAACGVEAGEEEEEEGGELEEEQSVSRTEESEEAESVSGLSDVEFPAEPLQADDTGATSNPDELIELQLLELLEEDSGTEVDIEMLQRLAEDPTGQTEEPEMCKDADQNVDPEQATAADNNEEPERDAERIENSREVLELTEKLEGHCDQPTSRDVEVSLQPEQPEVAGEPEQIQAEEQRSEDQTGRSQRLEDSPQMELMAEPTQHENADLQATHSEWTARVEAEDPRAAERREQTEPPEQSEQPLQPSLSERLVQPEKTDESETTAQLSPETEVARQTAEAEFSQVDRQTEAPHQAAGGGGGGGEDGGVKTDSRETAVPHMNGGEVDGETASRLADRLFKLDGIQRVDVVKHLDKDNDFSRAVGEEYLKYFDFTGQTLDHALRSFLKVVVLIGETQERERVLQHFSCRFHQCNPDSFTSSGAVLALTCALMLLNTDLHGQNVGKSMSSSKFVSNLDKMNEGENFSKDLLKTLYNSIKSEPLEWAVDEEELKNSVWVDEDAAEGAPLRSKANPFQDVPHDKTASVVKEGFLQRKLHADIDGKRTPWGKRGWKTFFGVLRGMVLYLQKNDYMRDQPTNEEVVSVHHSLAEQASDYTKKPHVFRLQTADWRVFLFQASSKVEMNSWISRINLQSALHSSPPFPAAVGSQRRFCRPILPASQSAHTLDRQLQSHAGMLESFKADLLYLQQNLPEGKKAKAKELEEHRVRAEYLQHEMCRYESYIQSLQAWKSVKKTGHGELSIADMNLFDKAVRTESLGEEEEEEDELKKSYSSPSLELEMPPPTIVKVRRNISERRTYRRTIIPRWNKEA